MPPASGREHQPPERHVMTRGQYAAIFGVPFESTASPLRASTPVPPVPPQDPVPDLAAGEVDVWLTEWQVDEVHFDVTVGEHVTWSLTAMNQQRVDRLLPRHRTVPLQLDMYAEDLHEAEDLVWHDVTGTVTRIDQVSVRYVMSDDPAERGTRVPEAGGGQQHRVPSLCHRQPHHGDITSWIVRVQS